MAKKLTVIIGAGASASINQNQSNPIGDSNYKPPITRDIFSTGGVFRAILQSYPLAETLASDIERKIRQNKQGIGLEQILKSYEVSLQGKPHNHRTAQFLEIPLYFNHLFGEISNQFTSRPDEYNNLVNDILDTVDEILFLDLNYDTLLEIPLSRIFHVDFSEESHYIQPTWSLVKLHGSTNWYRKFVQVKLEEPTNLTYFQLLSNSTLPLPLEHEITLFPRNVYNQKIVQEVINGNSERIPIYPAITIPVDGKYEINCSPSHEQKAKDFLFDCDNYLIIGTSGKDQDILDLLAKHAKVSKVLIVGRDETNVTKTKENFMSAVPQFHDDTSVYFHQYGFSQFIESGELNNFLSALN